MIEKIYLKNCKVLLDDLGDGRGELTIIGDTVHSYFWGSMGSDLKTFLLGTSPCYFAGKLVDYHDKNEFDGKRSVRKIRRYIKDELSYDMPWYKFMPAQKELREALKELEHCSSQEEFVAELTQLPDKLYCFDMSREDEKEFMSIVINGLCSEPWYFIEMKPSRQYLFVEGVLPELQKYIKKEFKTVEV